MLRVVPFLALVLLIISAVLPSSWQVSAQSPPTPFKVAYDASNTLQYVVLRSHCLVLDLDLVLAQQVGYPGSVIVDGAVTHGHLWSGDIARAASPSPHLQDPSRRQRTLVNVTRDTSLDYGAGTVSYCPPPLLSMNESQLEAGDVLVNDTVPLRFMPTPVTHDHPVQPFLLVFLTVPLTFEPVRPVSTVWVDGRRWMDDLATTPPTPPLPRTADNDGDDADNGGDDEDGGQAHPLTSPPPLPPPNDLYAADTKVLPIPLALRAELRRHWQPHGAADVLRYTRRPLLLLSSLWNITVEANATVAAEVSEAELEHEPTPMQALDVVELFALDGVDQLSPCVLYAVEGGNDAAANNLADNVDGEEEDDDDGDDNNDGAVNDPHHGDGVDELPQAHRIDTLPFLFPPSTQIRFRVDLTEEEVHDAMAEFLSTVNYSAEASAGQGFPPLCSIGYRARQRGSADFTRTGVLNVAWSPPPRSTITTADVLVSDAENSVLISAVATPSDFAATMTSTFELKQLCAMSFAGTPSFQVTMPASPHCVACLTDGQVCEMTLSATYNFTKTASTAALKEQGALLLPAQRTDNATEALLQTVFRLVGAVRFYTLGAHRLLPGEHVSGGAVSKARVFDPRIFESLNRMVAQTREEVHFDAANASAVVVDVFSLLPSLLRRLVDRVYVRADPALGFSGQLFSAAVPSTAADARRGLRWRRVLPVDLNTPETGLKVVDGREYVEVVGRAQLLRYLPPASWWSASCGSTTDNTAAVRDGVDIAVPIIEAAPSSMSVTFQAAPQRCRSGAATPTETILKELGLENSVRTLPIVSTHSFVHRHAANPLRLLVSSLGSAAVPPAQLPSAAQPREIRFVSLPSHGTLSRLPACDNSSKEGQWLFGHCTPPHPQQPLTGGAMAKIRSSLSADGGCVCCLQECSPYVGEPLTVGSVLAAGGVASNSSSQNFAEPFWAVYTPPITASNTDAATGEKGTAAKDLREEAAEEIIRYVVWPVQLPLQVHEVVLHIRAWPDSAVRPAFLLPAAHVNDGNNGDIAHSPTEMRRLFGETTFHVLRMSARPDVETALLGWHHSSRLNAVFPWQVYECVALRGGGDTSTVEARLRTSYARSLRPLPRTWKFGVHGYWPSLTQGCIVVGFKSEPLPQLAVHAVLKAAASNASTGMCLINKESVAGEAVAVANFTVQPYPPSWPSQRTVAWRPLVIAEDRAWRTDIAPDASRFVRIAVPERWGFVPPRQPIHPFHLTARFTAAEAEDNVANDEDEDDAMDAVEVRLTRAPQQGCVLQPPHRSCVQQGQRLDFSRCGDGDMEAPSFRRQRYCVHLTYALQRTNLHRPALMRDVLEVTAAAREGGSAAGVKLTIALEGTRAKSGSLVKRGLLAVVVLVLVVALTVPRRAVRQLCSRKRHPQKVRGQQAAYAVVGREEAAP